MKAELIATCVKLNPADVPALREMIDTARKITFKTFARHCNWQPVAHALGYSVGREPGLHLAKDWAVSFHRSTWHGKPCWYMDWSRIEHIFQQPAVQGPSSLI